MQVDYRVLAQEVAYYSLRSLSTPVQVHMSTCMLELLFLSFHVIFPPLSILFTGSRSRV